MQSWALMKLVLAGPSVGWVHGSLLVSLTLNSQRKSLKSAVAVGLKIPPGMFRLMHIS